jgi:hypothetical protein
MNNDIQQLKDQIQKLQQQVDIQQSKFDMHFHDGNNSQRINMSDLFSGMIWGNAGSSSSSLTVTEPRISSTSICVASTPFVVSFSAPHSYILTNIGGSLYTAYYIIIF